MRYVPFDHIVRDICIVQLQDSNLTQYMRVARALRSALVQVQLHFMPAIRSAQITIDDNYIAYLPVDASVVTKVGVLTTDGRIRPLLQDRRLRRYEVQKALDVPLYCECDQPPVTTTSVPDDALSCCVFHNCYWGGSYYGELYAHSSSLDGGGTWRHNLQAGVLEMGSGFYVAPDMTILVEYKSLGAEEYLVIPTEAQATLKAYALYELRMDQDPYRARVHMGEFRRHARMLKSLYKPVNALEVLSAFMSGQKATVKG